MYIRPKVFLVTNCIILSMMLIMIISCNLIRSSSCSKALFTNFFNESYSRSKFHSIISKK